MSKCSRVTPYVSNIFWRKNFEKSKFFTRWRVKTVLWCFKLFENLRQSCTLQGWDLISSSGGHPISPKIPFLQVLLHVCRPPPQDWLQVLWIFITQSSTVAERHYLSFLTVFCDYVGGMISKNRKLSSRRCNKKLYTFGNLKHVKRVTVLISSGQN